MVTEPVTSEGAPRAPLVEAYNEVAELQHINKRYSRVAALEDASLALNAGEVLALLGPNGAGKTTALSLTLERIRVLMRIGEMIETDTWP